MRVFFADDDDKQIDEKICSDKNRDDEIYNADNVRISVHIAVHNCAPSFSREGNENNKGSIADIVII